MTNLQTTSMSIEKLFGEVDDALNTASLVLYLGHVGKIGLSVYIPVVLVANIQIWEHVPHFYGYKAEVFPAKTIPKNLDLSNKTDLDFWDCFGSYKMDLDYLARKKNHFTREKKKKYLTAEFHTTEKHNWDTFGGIKSCLIAK